MKVEPENEGLQVSSYVLSIENVNEGSQPNGSIPFSKKDKNGCNIATTGHENG